MSFVWKADHRLLPEEEIARRVHAVSLSMGLDEFATVLALMCIRQESDFWCPWNREDPSSEKYAHDSESDDGRSVGRYQQQNGRAGEVLPEGDRDNWWGTMESRMGLESSTRKFLERLEDDYHRGMGNPYECSVLIDNVQQSYWDGKASHPGYYGKHYDYCWGLLHRALEGGVQTQPPPSEKPRPSIEPNPLWRGDPIWLPQVLRAFGVNVTEMDGWLERGHGDFGKIDWVLWHHTGNVNETDDGIAHHPSLGLAANMLVHPDGRCVLTGVGVAWHGGKGVYPGIPEDNINQVSIGIECAHSGAHGDPWPDVQMQAMINIGAAIKWFLVLPSDHQIAHKEWAGAQNPLGINKQGKPDPIDIDMSWFRSAIATRAIDGPTQGEDDPLSSANIAKLEAAADKILGYPDDAALRGRYPSRARTRPDDFGVDDGVGMPLWSHGDVYDLLTAYSAIEFADRDCLNRLIALANGTGPGARYSNGETDHGAIAWAQGVLNTVKARHPEAVKSDGK